MKSNTGTIGKNRGWLQGQGLLALHIAMVVVSILGLIYAFSR
jgi:hypothetical protein